MTRNEFRLFACNFFSLTGVCIPTSRDASLSMLRGSSAVTRRTRERSPWPPRHSSWTDQIYAGPLGPLADSLGPLADSLGPLADSLGPLADSLDPLQYIGSFECSCFACPGRRRWDGVVIWRWHREVVFCKRKGVGRGTGCSFFNGHP